MATFSHQAVGSCATLVDILQHRATVEANCPAYTFLTGGEDPEQALDFEALDRRCRAVAVALQERGAMGQRVLLYFPPGLDFLTAFLGCLYAGAVAVPTSTSRPGRPAPRLHSVMKDAEVALALTSLSERNNFIAHLEACGFPAGFPCLSVDQLDPQQEVDWNPPDIDGGTLAFLQYTSGSTSAPKGVMVSHGNLITNTKIIQTAFEQTPGITIVSWLPLFHDMGLIGTALDSLTLGAHCVFMAPQDFLMKPVRWLKAISRFKAHTSGGPNFGYSLCVKKVRPEQLDGVDLSSWKVAFNGAERVRPDTVRQFAEAFAGVGFQPAGMFPCYGLAEVTLYASGVRCVDEPIIRSFDGESLEEGRGRLASTDSLRSIELVSCGRAICNHEMLVVDPEELTALEPGRVGEIWVKGDSVAKGYWRRPEESKDTFAAHTSDGRGPFLRTGDLGFVLDKELYLTGRLKDLIISSGRNHHPEDIEKTVESCHGMIRLGGVGAFSYEQEGQERVGLLVEVGRDAFRAETDESAVLTPKELAACVRQAVFAAHDLNLHSVNLILAGTLPKTSSGKVQRHAARQEFLSGKLASVQ